MNEQINEQILVAAEALVSDIKAMQAKDNPNWFEKFSAWEFDEDEMGLELMSIEWPNLAISLKMLQDALTLDREARQARENLKIAEIQAKMLHGETRGEPR